jgi:hypothetical protein
MSSIVNPPPAPEVDSTQIPSRRFISVIGITLVTWATLLFYVLIKVWPPNPWPDAGSPMYFFSKISVLRFELPSGSLDQRLIFLVIIVGALGSFIHSATSFADYVGNRKFLVSWTWWYLLRPFVGAALALALYFVMRAGFVTGDANATEAISRFGVATLAALSGLFSKQATDKLEEVFTTFFKPSPGKGDAKRGDKLDALSITGFAPTTGEEGDVVKITGTGFVENASVSFGNVKAVDVVVENATSIRATAPAHAPGKVAVVVKNPDGKEVTAQGQFTYKAGTAGAGGAPTITGFAPPNGPQSGGIVVKITGTGFVEKATVKFGGVDADVVVESATSIKATTPKHAPGPVDVVVTNPDGKTVTAATKFTFDV